ncbi:MAG: outer membrane protein assembly factor BamD [Crocinitomicaceae bacterium]|nr:outer membrane protein assembly factor BamD [Crocinitomicaceae bacterium]
MKKFTYIFAGLTAIILASSCSDYNRVLKSDDYGDKFDMANYLYDSVATSSSKVRSIALYEQIYQRTPKQGEGELAYFRIGKAYYEGGDYYMAGYYLSQFPQRFPFSPKAEESTFLSAMCSVNNSPDWSLDQLETEVAINNLQQFVNRYPNSTLIDSCNNIIDGLRFKLETKAFESVRLYSKTERFMAAESSAMTFMEDYPMSEFKEEVHYLLVLNSYYLAKNSIEKKKKARIEQTIERYSTFVAAFPDSKYVRTLASYDDVMRKDLKEY